MKKLHAEFGGSVQFLDVMIRQAHPGPGAEPYTSDAQKMRDGERFKRGDAIPYPVLVDDLPGTVHQVYGGLADPTYLIDSDGRVAFYNMWSHGPTLHRAIEALLAQGGRGVVRSVRDDGIDHVPHLLASFADGWHGLRRGAPQSVIDLELASPGVASGIWLGYQVRPLLAPLALRAKPLPAAAKVGLALGALALAGLLITRRGLEGRTPSRHPARRNHG
jgi:hypothetical protein